MLVDGRRDPELLMPYELMNHLVVAYYHRDQDLVRRWQERVFPRVNASLGPGADEKLRAVMRPFADAWRCEVLNDQIPPAPECSDRMHSLCPARGAALAAARMAFGQVEFDRFLYEVVAPHAITAVSHSSPSLTSAIEFHQWQEEGCPDPSGSRAHPPRQNDSSNF